MATAKESVGKGREWLLLVAAVLVSLLVALALIRWFAPSLLGIREDMQVVRVSKELPPFFEGVFREGGPVTEGFILQDPYTRVRARPLFPAAPAYGPHDVLGFRNAAVPNVVDILTIGDSQTYGNNAPLSENWPSALAATWQTERPVVYNMSTGGWGGVQYLEMLRYGVAFQPRVLVVAFYSGNDALESFIMAYTDERYAGLRPDETLATSDLPPTTPFPPPKEDLWAATFKDGSAITFAPKHRLSSNDTSHVAVRAGYVIMSGVAAHIAAMAQTRNIRVVFTIIPTKELVYAERIRRERLEATEAYRQLIEMELENLNGLAGFIAQLPGAIYVDVLAPLQQAALRIADLYPASADGHPMSAGYRVIARAIAPVVKPLLPATLRGLFSIDVGNGLRRVVLVTAGGVWDFQSERILRANGWKPEAARAIRARDIAAYSSRGIISSVDPQRYGPAAVR